MTYSTRICWVSFENNSFLQFFCVLIHCSADCWLFPQAICPSPKTIGFKTIENNRKISITKEICITIDPKKIPGRKPDSEAGCIFENFTPKQGNSLKTLAAGTRNHGVSLPPPREWTYTWHPWALAFSK